MALVYILLYIAQEVLILHTVNGNGACLHGDIRLETTGDREGVVQLCEGTNWRTVCRERMNDRWNQHAGNLACSQLGYSNEGSIVTFKCAPKDDRYFRNIDCRNTGTNLTACGYSSSDDCSGHNCGGSDKRHAKVQCKAACTTGAIRLVDGANYREGRVEVCVDGRWGTVCRNNQEGLAEAVCVQLGFPAEYAESIPLEVAPFFECNINTDGMISCTTASGSCDRSLGVECQTHQTVVERTISTCREECQEMIDERENTCQENCEVRIDEQDSACNSTISKTIRTYNREQEASSKSATGALGGVVGVLLVVIVVLAVGWTLTCVAIGNRNIINKKQTQTDSTEPTSATNHQFANPVYDSITDNNYSSSGPTYELVDTNGRTAATYSVVNRENLAPEQIAGNEDHDYHVLEAGPGEGVRGCNGEGACDYEVPVSRHSQVPLCEEEYSTLKH